MLMSKSMLAGAVICAAFLFSGTVGAEQKKTPPLGDIRAQQLQLRDEVMAGKGAYKDMSREKRDQLAARQSEVIALIGERQSLDELTEAEKTQAFNTLEWINETVSNAEDERIVCERQRPIGSNRVQRVCATVAERRKQREAVENGLMPRTLCNGEEPCSNN